MNLKEDYYVSKIRYKKILKPWLIKKHYAHRMPTVQFAYGLYKKQGSSFMSKTFNIPELCGIITYGPPAGAKTRRSICGDDFIEYVFELNRLCLNSGLPANAGSFLISRSIKSMPKNSILVSYSDIGQGHIGYIYQATNWLYTGISDMSGSFSKIEINGVDKQLTSKSFFHKLGTSSKKAIQEKHPEAIFHPYTRKHRYVFFKNKKMQKYLIHSIEKYPKGETSRYDCLDIIDNKLQEKK